jgi:hypothetical protein
MSDEYESIWKKAAVAYFQHNNQASARRKWENHV